MNKLFTRICMLFLMALVVLALPMRAYATDSDNNGDTDERTFAEEPGDSDSGSDLAAPNVGNRVTIELNDGNGSVNGALQIVLILTGIALLPFLLLTITSFTRIIIVLHFTRQALNTQTAPPNMVLIGIALFLTIYIMSPTLTAVYNDAIVPYNSGTITTAEALDKGIHPLREYMYPQTEVKDVTVFMEIA